MADKNPVIIIQARLGSTRLPGKVLKDAVGRPLLAWLLSRLTHAGLPTVLAVPREEQGQFTELAAEFPIQVFGGDGEDVLDRYAEAARANGADPVIRVTGDNPLTSVTCLRLCLERFEQMGADLCHPVGLPYGAGVEVVGRQALEAAWKNAREPDEREHVTRWIYKNPGRFEIIPHEVPPDHHAPDLRVTVDTDEDFARFEAIARSVKPRKYIRLVDAIAFLQKHGPAPAAKAIPEPAAPSVPAPAPRAIHLAAEDPASNRGKVIPPAASTKPVSAEEAALIATPKEAPPPPKAETPKPVEKPAPKPPEVSPPPAPVVPVAVAPIPPPAPAPLPSHPEGVNLQEGGFSAVRRAAAAFLANLGKGDGSPKTTPAPAPAEAPVADHGFAPIPADSEDEPKAPRKKSSKPAARKAAKKTAAKGGKPKAPKGPQA